MRKICALLLALLSVPVLATSPLEIEPMVPGEVLVKIRPGSMGKFLAKKSLMGLDVRKELHLLSGDYFLIKGEESISSLMSQFAEMDEVEFSEPNYRYKVLVNFPTFENFFQVSAEKSSASARQDPLYAWQWGLNNNGENEPSSNQKVSRAIAGVDLNAEAAWALTRGSRRVVIGVVDSGLDVHHPDLKNNIWVNPGEIPGNGKDDDKNGFIDDVYGWSGLRNNGDVSDETGHGTHCAGTIGAEHDNGIGISGVMGEVSIMALKFIDADGFGTTADAVEVIDYAIRMNVDVLSNSWGGGPYSRVLENAIKKARDKGILFVAAAGNQSANNDLIPYYPANYPFSNVISVANHTASDQISSFSNFGATQVHVAAPGNMILSTIPGGQYQVRSGTSMATPYVAGALGLLIAEQGRLPVAEARHRLMNTSVKGPNYQGRVLSAGRVNLYQLLTK